MDSPTREAIRRMGDALRSGAPDLNLGSFGLSEIPDWLGDLVELEELVLSNNKLKSLPESVRHLPKLRHVQLANNAFSEFPQCVLDLRGLEWLDLSRNSLTELPSELARLENLETLNLANNNLSEPPTSLRTLPRLTSLSLQGNPLPIELLAAADSGVQNLRLYLTRLEEEGVPLWDAKILLVGEGEVGKSSLLGALRGDPWVENRDSTHGLEIKPLRVEHPSLPDVMLNLNAWDFAGQDIYRPTHQLFFTGAAVYLVVWKPRIGAQQAGVDYWLRTIRLRAPVGSKAIVVATHGGPKEHHANIEAARLRESYPGIIADFFSVDSSTIDDRIDDLRHRIAEVAASLPDVGRPFPASWSDFRNSLVPPQAGLSKLTNDDQQLAFLRYGELEARAEVRGLPPESSRAICAIASRCGYWIHYGSEPPGLDDLVVVRPHWLAKAISFVLDDAPTRRNNGLLAKDRLGEIWGNPNRPLEEQYPTELHALFLELMEDYDLAYEVDQTAEDLEANGRLWLVAQLVSERVDSSFVDQFMDKRDLSERECEFVVRVIDDSTRRPEVAEGLLYRLIVRFHRYSLGVGDYTRAVHWQKGVVFSRPVFGRAVVTLEAEGMRIRAVGAKPDWFADQLAEDIRTVVSRYWSTLSTDYAVSCRSECGISEPGKALFSVDKLLKSKYPDVQCPIPGCDAQPSIERLISGLSFEGTFMAEAEQRFAETVRSEVGKLGVNIRASQVGASGKIALVSQDLKELADRIDHTLTPYLSERLDSLDSRLEGLPTEIATIAAETTRSIETYLEAFDDPIFNGPSLIVVEVSQPGLVRRLARRCEVTVSLCCEHSKLPLYVLHNNPKYGRFTFNVPRESLKRWLPLASIVIKLLAGYAPLGLAVTELELPAKAWESLKLQLEVAEKSLGALAETVDVTHKETGDRVSDRLPLGSVDRKALLSIHEAVRLQDPSFAGLVPVRDRQSKARLWVDPQFRDKYPRAVVS